ncbi:MAG: hypothetical protein IJW64_05800 [Clostridia bacterium]|nr:hypothetical protein [Clostridia bacterium]
MTSKKTIFYTVQSFAQKTENDTYMMPENIEYEIPLENEISSNSLFYTASGETEISLYLVS